MAKWARRPTEAPVGPAPIPSADRTSRSFAHFVPDTSSSTIIAVAIDVCSASIAVGVGVWWSSRAESVTAPWTAALFVPIIVTLCALQAFYRPRLDRGFIDQIAVLETNIALAAILPMGVENLGGLAGPSSATVSRVWFCAALLMPASRLLHTAVTKRQRRLRRFSTPTLIVGNGVVATRVIERLRASPEYGLNPIGIIDVEPPQSGDVKPALNADVPVLGPPDSIDELIRTTGAKAIVITFSHVRDELLTRVVQVGHRNNMRVWVVCRLP